MSTLGPWAVSAHSTRLPSVVSADGQSVIAERVFNGNARLIAASPQLLEACKAAADHLREERKNKTTHPIGQCPVLDVVLAAIAKAQGETYKCGGLAQRLEHSPYKREVEGSSPSSAIGRTNL